jgi:hypothetical protein
LGGGNGSNNLRRSKPAQKIKTSSTEAVQVVNSYLESAREGEIKESGELDMRTETIELTPELAEKLLGGAAANRHASPKLVLAYSRDVKEGRWTLNGESVKVNAAGQMFDGRHRCLAVVAAKTSIMTAIAWDADEDNVDMGRPRSYGDTLAITGAPNARNLGAAVTAVTNWLAGYRPGLAGSFKSTFAEKDKILADHPEILFSVQRANAVKTSIPVSPSILALCHWLFSAISPDEANEFMGNVAHGVALEAGNAALTLRNRLIKDRLTRRGSLSERDSAALIILAWNAYRERRLIIKLQLPNPLTTQNFPEPRP